MPGIESVESEDGCHAAVLLAEAGASTERLQAFDLAPSVPSQDWHSNDQGRSFALALDRPRKKGKFMSPRNPTKEQALELIRQRGIEFETILDVGVLTGTPELIKAFPDKHHCLFEPVIEFQPEISCAYDGISHEIITCAISNADGQTTLETATIIEGTQISHSAMVDGPAKTASQRTVNMHKLDSVLAMYPRRGPFFLKIDIDGQELKVIEGAHQTLKQTSIVMIEASYPTMSERLTALEYHGFEILDIVEPCYYDDVFWQCDILMIRRDLRGEKFKSINDDFQPELYVPYRG